MNDTRTSHVLAQVTLSATAPFIDLNQTNIAKTAFDTFNDRLSMSSSYCAFLVLLGIYLSKHHFTVLQYR